MSCQLKTKMHSMSTLQTNIKFVAWMKDGTIVVLIDQKRYTYITDAIYHNRWRRLSRRAPFRVLNEIKACDKSYKRAADTQS